MRVLGRRLFSSGSTRVSRTRSVVPSYVYGGRIAMELLGDEVLQQEALLVIERFPTSGLFPGLQLRP